MTTENQTLFSFVEADKADRYFTSLCKHFARKVVVERIGDTAQVQFPMGICRMRQQGRRMEFCCIAAETTALEAVRNIVEDHVTKFGELRGTSMRWTSTLESIDVSQ